ncbi:MAG TPA: peptidylprolyl isomerase [Allosphingosinicella sp.]|uniref:peptidylprolyl isomerase n=1 Tax=Allosphingosinicella sp. TaxID=2823234 RepID=UPI002ED9E9AA
MATSLVAAAAVAQGAQSPTSPPGLNIPANPQFLGNVDPTVRKATAIVNGHVITGTDLDHRLAMVLYSVRQNGNQITDEEAQRLRQQVLTNLVDETLQIQEAEAKEIKVEPREIDQAYAQYAQGFGRTAEQFSEFLKTIGASDRTVKRQIQAEYAWVRLQRRQIQPFVNVSQEEVQSVIDRLNASKGERKYKIGEIFLAATAENDAQVRANAERIVQQVRQGAPFVAYARQFSEASTAAVGGDLGWVSADQLPDPLPQAAQTLPVGQVSNPIPVAGGYSILLVQDTRQELMPDERDAVLSLKQLSLRFPAGTTQAQATPQVERLIRTAQTMGGCGNAEQAAQTIGAEVTSNDQVPVRELPGPLQEMLLKLNIGQSTSPFGSVSDRVSVLVVCGRESASEPQLPSAEQVYAQLEEQRVAMRARRYLRDLRRDAVVDYR